MATKPAATVENAIKTMKIAFFDTHKYEKPFFENENKKYNFTINWLSPRLTRETVELAKGHDVVCSFVEDQIDAPTIEILKTLGVKMLALRCAGYNHLDLPMAKKAGLRVSRVPDYSPYAVAEHALALLMTLNRKTHRAYARVRELNFSLEGLMGFDLHGKSVGVIGTGKIGTVFCEIMQAFGCQVYAYDPHPSEKLKAKGVQYVSLSDLLQWSDIISLHVPLTPETKHLIDAKALAKMKKGVIIINTGRGALIDTKELIESLKTNHIGAAGLDVYEEEEGIFFHDLSGHILQDDNLSRLLTFPNVLITSHQAFLTSDALKNIAETTLKNVNCFAQNQSSPNDL